MIASTTLNILNLSSNGLSGELPLLTGSCAILELSSNEFERNLTKLLKWGNLEEMLKEHEKQIQLAVRKARLDKVKTKKAYNDNGQTESLLPHGRNNR